MRSLGHWAAWFGAGRSWWEEEGWWEQASLPSVGKSGSCEGRAGAGSSLGEDTRPVPLAASDDRCFPWASPARDPMTFCPLLGKTVFRVAWPGDEQGRKGAMHQKEGRGHQGNEGRAHSFLTASSYGHWGGGVGEGLSLISGLKPRCPQCNAE